MSRLECKHGRLARACTECEAEETITDLRAKLQAAELVIKEMSGAQFGLYHNRLRDGSGKCGEPCGVCRAEAAERGVEKWKRRLENLQTQISGTTYYVNSEEVSKLKAEVARLKKGDKYHEVCTAREIQHIARITELEAEAARLKQDLTNMTYSNDQHRKMAESWRGRAVRADELEAENNGLIIKLQFPESVIRDEKQIERTATEAALRWAWKDSHMAHTMAPWLHDLKRDKYIARGLDALLNETNNQGETK